jgi:hypothetical protein
LGLEKIRKKGGKIGKKYGKGGVTWRERERMCVE